MQRLRLRQSQIDLPPGGLQEVIYGTDPETTR